MIDIESYRRNAIDCVRQAQGEADPADRNILLNVALAWLRLAQQTAALEAPDGPLADPDEETFDDDRFVEEPQPQPAA